MNAALDFVNGLILETGERWGQVATDVQRADLAAVLDPASAQPYSWLGRSRGYSKTTDLGAAGLAVLLKQAPAGSKSYAVAADQGQARLLLDALEGFVLRSPELARLIEVQAWKVIARHGGASLEALAADAAGAWGLRPYFAVCDELGMWGTTGSPRRIWDAISSAMPKTQGRLVLATTASDPAHWAYKIREHALGDPLWRISETTGAPPWMPEHLIAEQRRRLPESSFRRLFLNEWVSGEDRLVAVEDLRACVMLAGPQPPLAGMRYVIGLDLGLKRDRTVAAVCHAEHGIVTLDRLEVWQGSRLRPVRIADVGEWLAHAAREYNGAQIVADPWQSVGLGQDLRRRGVSVREYVFTAQSVGRLASSLFVLLREHALRLPDDDALLDELANVRLRETAPGIVRLDHDSGRHDDRAVALALACHRLVERGEAPRPATWTSPVDAVIRWAGKPRRREELPAAIDGAPVARVGPSLARRRTARLIALSARDPSRRWPSGLGLIAHDGIAEPEGYLARGSKR